MSEKTPQPTEVLIARLRRVAKRLDRYFAAGWTEARDSMAWKARANTCWQAAARLEELEKLARGGLRERQP